MQLRNAHLLIGCEPHSDPRFEISLRLNSALLRMPLVFAKARELGLEGIVSKRAGSLYRSGTSRSWLKSKNSAFVRT